MRDDDSHDSLYRQLKSAYTESRKIERKYLEDPGACSLSDCEWPEVVALSTKLLAEEAKDFEVTAFLCDGLLRVHGYAGLRDAFRLAKQLVEQFWDDLYPLPEDGDLKPRVRSFSDLLGADKLTVSVKGVPVTARDRYSLLDYEQAVLFDQADSKEQQRRIEIAERSNVTLVKLTEFEQDVRNSPTQFYRDLLSDISEAIIELDGLAEALEEKCGTDSDGRDVAPPTRAIRAELNVCLDTLRSLVGDRLGSEETQEPDGKQEDGSNVPSTIVQPSTAPGQGQVLTREVAYRALAELADFFRRTEPHSPVSHHIEEAVRWGKMTLPDLLAELIADEDTRQKVYTRVGIELPKAEDD